MGRGMKEICMKNLQVTCAVCPHRCRLSPGQRGLCRVRANEGGRVALTTYGEVCALHLDPVEKKPFYHLMPGEAVLSIGMPGCNLRCEGCQNAVISQVGSCADAARLRPERVPVFALEQDARWVAYTYTEPLVSYEYLVDCCTAVQHAGLRNALVTAAYVNPEPLEKLLPLISAANVDVKSFSDAFYRQHCGGSLDPVLDALKMMRGAGIHLEITQLVIPGMNDDEAQFRGLADWVNRELGSEIPLHFSRFFPAHRLLYARSTPLETLERAVEIARECGLIHVYTGNALFDVPKVTVCAQCRAPLVVREGFRLVENRLKDGCCPDCRAPLYGVWS